MTARAIDPLASNVRRPLSLASSAWLMRYVAFQFLCQLALLVPALSPIRLLLRVAAFLGSLTLLVLVPAGRARRNPVAWCAYSVLGLMVLEFFHPEGAGPIPALAQIAMYVAILGPVFWVPRIEITTKTFQRMMTVFWLFYTAGAILGVLQAYFPGQFQPPLSSVIADMGAAHVADLQITLASGERVFRPMGLTDSPGGAASSGLYAVLFGVGIFQTRPFFGARIVSIAGMLAGMMCLYLCQVRSLVVALGICLVAVAVLLAVSGQLSRLVGGLLTVGAAVPIAFALAASLGGHGMTDRLSTLFAGDPGSVYYTNRGHFLEHTLTTLLPQYPLGAGLGRWGMINHYFGSYADSIWVEIQWTGWVLDGGVPLVLLYTAALCIASWQCVRIAMRHRHRGDLILSTWGAVLTAYNVGAVALCFNYAVFIGAMGVEFWLLNMAFLGAAELSQRDRESPLFSQISA